MRKDAVKNCVRDKLAELGVPEHLVCVRPVCSMVELTMLSGGIMDRVEFKSGITHHELSQKLGELESLWHQRVTSGQKDIEECIAEAELADAD